MHRGRRKTDGRASFERTPSKGEAPIAAHRQSRPDIIAWVGQRILPHEAEVRSRLRRLGVPETEIGDIVQDAYVALARLDTVAHIRNPRAYFYATARHALLQRIRHDRIVRIETLTEAQSLVIGDEAPDPYRQTSARLELARVERLIAALPDRCRMIFLLRRVHGVPQREIAARMGVSEAVVEAQATRGLRLLMRAIEDEEQAARRERPSGREQDHDQLRR